MVPGCRSRRAFTLVELLVVIAIIAVLIGLLMPALSAARRRANTLVCASNLRNLGAVMQMYATDNKGFVPQDRSQGVSGHVFWAEAFAPYLSQRLPAVPESNTNRDKIFAPYYAKIAVYRCPVFPNEKQPVCFLANGWDQSSAAGGTQGMFNLTRFRRAAEIVYLTEGNKNRLLDSFEFHDIWLSTHLPQGPVSERRMLDDNRHGGLINQLYLDGHVAGKLFKSVTVKDFYVGK